MITSWYYWQMGMYCTVHSTVLQIEFGCKEATHRLAYDLGGPNEHEFVNQNELPQCQDEYARCQRVDAAEMNFETGVSCFELVFAWCYTLFPAFHVSPFMSNDLKIYIPVY